MSTYKPPSATQVAEAMRRITKTQLRRAFFEGIENPLWVKPLAEAGAFSNPPEPVRTDDGYIQDAYWPEAEYLSKVAVQAPEEVVDVLLTLGATENSWVRRAVFEIGAKIPAEQAARLKPLIKAWQRTGLGWRTDPRDLVRFAVNLLEGGEREVGTWFANLIFKPSKTETDRRPSAVLEDYWYEQELPKLVEVLEPGDLELVLSWLVAFERAIGHLTTKFDMTYHSRDAIRQALDSVYEVEQALIDAVRDLAVDAMLADPATAKEVLLKSNMLLARKIGLFSLSDALRRTSDGDERRVPLLTVADDLLAEEASSDDSCRIDYAELARSVARVTGEPLAALNQLIDSGPRAETERIRDWLREGASDETEVDERVQDYVDRWKHRWLSALGTEALPAQLQTQLAELDVRYGVIEAPLVPTKRVEGWTGPISALSQDEMAAMSPAELVAHLESWHATGNRWGPVPSHEGQGRELQGLLTTDPKAFVGTDDLIGRLRPTYLRAILQGWEGAIKAGLLPDWTQVADLTRAVLAHADTSDFPIEGDRPWDDDTDYRAAKQAAVGLLEELAQTRASPVIRDDVLAQFAEILITLADSETAWNEYNGYSADSGMDALTTSLNWQWPIRLRGLIHLMSRGKGRSWYRAAKSALERELARDDSRGASRAVLGEGLGRLVDADPEWIIPKVPEWFGHEEEMAVAQQIALTTAMAVHRYHPKLYELLAPPMMSALASEEPIVPGWDNHTDPVRRIGEWVIDALIRGHVTTDDPVATRFFTDAPAKVRGEAIGHIAWNFMHAAIVDEEIRDRFADLWDQRVRYVRAHPEDEEELSGFFWFVRSHKFEVTWWLPRLKEAVELHPGLSSECHMISDEIAESAKTDPRTALDALKLILDGRDDSGRVSYMMERNALPTVIARAIDSGDASLRQDAVEYMNFLGQRGNLSLEAAVEGERQAEEPD